jgi:DNA primase
LVSSQGFGLSIDERRRLLEANAAAALFFRRELLRATTGWPLEYVKAHGAESVLSAESPWKVGYAPPTWSSLVDHLQEQGFGYGTLVRSGLLAWNEHGDAVDLHRDKLMLVAHDRRSSAVGFVGIGPDGVARSATSVTPVHRPSNVLVGAVEQRGLLAGGAVPVIVDEPVDAIAVSKAGVQAGGQWAGIPVCGGGLSTAQANMLRQFSSSDKVVVVLAGSEAERNQSVGYLQDLAFFFDSVRAVALPPRESLAGLAQESGAERVHDLLLTSRPLLTYRAGGRGFVALRSTDLDPPGPGPGF